MSQNKPQFSKIDQIFPSSFLIPNLTNSLANNELQKSMLFASNLIQNCLATNLNAENQRSFFENYLQILRAHSTLQSFPLANLAHLRPIPSLTESPLAQILKSGLLPFEATNGQDAGSFGDIKLPVLQHMELQNTWSESVDKLIKQLTGSNEDEKDGTLEPIEKTGKETLIAQSAFHEEFGTGLQKRTQTENLKITKPPLFQSSSDDRQQKVLEHSGNDCVTFLCRVCKEGFQDEESLARHQMMHEELKPFSCEICGKRFTQQGTVRQHMQIHRGLRRYQCDICGRRFNQRGPLRQHMVCHTGLRPYQCDSCDKAFTRKAHLEAHVTIHTGARDFYCELCRKDFSRFSSLCSHQKLHGSEKSFGCKKCGKSFPNSNQLWSHFRIHSVEKN